MTVNIISTYRIDLNCQLLSYSGTIKGSNENIEEVMGAGLDTQEALGGN